MGTMQNGFVLCMLTIIWLVAKNKPSMCSLTMRQSIYFI